MCAPLAPTLVREACSAHAECSAHASPFAPNAGGVGLEWRSLVQVPKRNPYGKVHDVGRARGPAADFCVAGNVSRMEELFWNPEDIGAVAEPAFYLRELPPV